MQTKSPNLGVSTDSSDDTKGPRCSGMAVVVRAAVVSSACPERSACAEDQLVFGSEADVHTNPMHISSVDPSPQVTKWTGALRRRGSFWARVAS